MSGFVFAVLLSLFPDQYVDASQMNRYALAISSVVDEAEALPFSSSLAKERTAALLVAVAYHESAFLADIEYCTFKSRPGMTQDDGRAVGLFQAFKGYGWYGHSRKEICGNAQLQARLALRYLTMAVKKCGDVERGLGLYNSNKCQVTTYAARVFATYSKTMKAAVVR